MKVLGIETSGITGGVAVCEDRQIILEKGFGTGMQHAKELVPTIQRILSEVCWTINEIDLIAVDVGPGSYTGLRIGVTCAKTLAYALNKPVIDVPVFDIIAETYPASSLPLCPVIDAKRGYIYACIYIMEGSSRKRLSDFLVLKPVELLSRLPRPAIIFGDGVTRYKDVFQQEGVIIDSEERAIPKASHVALLGEKMYESGKRCEIDRLLPLYLRHAEAIEKWKEKKTNHRLSPRFLSSVFF